MSKTPKAPWNLGSSSGSKWALNSPGIAMGKSCWKSHLEKFLQEKSSWSACPGPSSSLNTEFSYRHKRFSCATDFQDLVGICSDGWDLHQEMFTRSVYNTFLMNLLKIGARVKFCILTLISRAICTPENPLLPSFSGILCIIHHCHLTFEINRWG